MMCISEDGKSSTEQRTIRLSHKKRYLFAFVLPWSSSMRQTTLTFGQKEETCIQTLKESPVHIGLHYG